MQALLSDGPLEGRTIGVDTDAEGRPPHTIDVDLEDGHIYFYDLKDVTGPGETAVYAFRDQQTL
jgi:hypothetical protein